MVSIYGSTDKLMLKQMMDETEVGFYSTAVTVCGLWCFILAAINDSMYPVILEAFESDISFWTKVQAIICDCVLYFLLEVSNIVYNVCKIHHFDIVWRSVSASNYPYENCYMVHCIFLFGRCEKCWVISYDCQKYLKYLYIGSAITNVVMNYFLIPLFGASGAAFASVVTQISTIMIFPLFIRKMRPNVKLMLDAICLKDVFWLHIGGNKNVCI